MKRNQYFDHNHSQNALSCRYNMDTNRVEARFEDGTTLSIDCIAIEDEYGNTPAQRAELDWLLFIIEKRYTMAFARTEVKELEPMVKSGKKRFVRYQEGAELYSMGLHTFEQLAKEAGAIYKIRRVVLVNLDIFDEYLDTFRM